MHRDRLSVQDYERRYNMNQLQRFETLLNRHRLSITGFSSILDFACGDGRLTRYLPKLAPQAQIFGCDTDPEAVIECQYRCPSCEIYANEPVPPLKYEDEKFDLIWSYSVFTSLPEANHQVWLQELSRTLKPGGVMLHTTHSYEYIRMAQVFSPECLVKYGFPESIDDFVKANRGYYYAIEYPSLPDYGLAIISKEYAETQWPKYSRLSLLDYAEAAIEGYPEGCQDIVILIKEPSNPAADFEPSILTESKRTKPSA